MEESNLGMESYLSFDSLFMTLREKVEAQSALGVSGEKGGGGGGGGGEGGGGGMD